MYGGSDSGATSDGYKEKDWNLETGEACRNVLEENGVKVYTSRIDDTFVSLRTRSKIANNMNCDLFVSIHYNASGGNYGLIIGSKKSGSTELAKDVKDNLLEVRDDIKIWENYGYYSVLNNTDMKSIIIETAFIDNKEDRKIADTPKERKIIGKQIAYGILDNLNIKYQENTNTNDKKTNPKDYLSKIPNKQETMLERILRITNRNNDSSVVKEKLEYVKRLLK